MSVFRGRVVPVLAALLGLVMIAGGGLKVAGEPHQTTAFAAWGLPPWFRDLVGTFEVLGGILLTVPATTPIGSLILSTIMVGALWAHAANNEWQQLAPVGVLLTLFLVIFRSNRSRAMRLLGGA